MRVTRNSLDTASGPDDWFTGAVSIDTIAAPEPPARAWRDRDPPRPEPPDGRD
jgi:hypothetical protein